MAGPVVAAVLLAAISACAIAFFYSKGCLLYYGDATAHINVARRILDSRTPGWEQVGTVWLPLPHLLMVPFVGIDSLWMSGLAGSIPCGLCFVLAGVLIFLAARRVFGDGAAAAAACLLLALNPNLLYLQAIPMTEAVFLACLAALLYCTVRFRETQSWGATIAAGLAALAASMTRYEGWFLIPFVALYFLVVARQRRLAHALVFGAIAALGPLYWFAHNYFFFDDALAFYSGPSSAKAIYQRALDANMARYPGDHDWRQAWLYLREAMLLCAGHPLVFMSLAGGLVALFRRAFWPLALLALAPLFYVWSLHSGATPIFLPHLWPHSYYNTRYALAALPLLAFAAAALVTIVPLRFRRIAATLVVVAAIAPWLAYPRMENWICWKESQVNSEARRAWTREGADYLRANYRRGEGIVTSFGDQTAIYQQAGIPLRETYSECNGRAWKAVMSAPQPPLHEKWAVAISGDIVARAIGRLQRAGPRYDLVKVIIVKGAPVIEIYRRQ
jgi:hypothetical protein